MGGGTPPVSKQSAWRTDFENIEAARVVTPAGGTAGVTALGKLCLLHVIQLHITCMMTACSHMLPMRMSVSWTVCVGQAKDRNSRYAVSTRLMMDAPSWARPAPRCPRAAPHHRAGDHPSGDSSAAPARGASRLLRIAARESRRRSGEPRCPAVPWPSLQRSHGGAAMPAKLFRELKASSCPRPSGVPGHKLGSALTLTCNR